DGIIVYHSDLRNENSSSYQDVLRISDGAEVPINMTIVSQNPLYVRGDFNTVDKKAVGIMSDAFNILSNVWQDSKSDSSNLNDRKASDTEVNAAVITGNTETTWGDYNGGFENIHRFSETWSGKTLTY